jgi:GAF domain-containing protein
MTTSDVIRPLEPRWSIGTQLAIGFILVIFVPLVIIGAYTYFQWQDQTRENTENAVQVTGDSKANELALAVERIRAASEDLVLNRTDTEIFFNALAQTSDNEDIDVANEILTQVWTDNLSIVFIRLFDVSRSEVASQGIEGLAGQNRRTNQLLSGAVLDTLISDIYASNDRTPLMDIIVPLRGTQGALRGHIIITQDLSRASETLGAEVAGVDLENTELNLNTLSISEIVRRQPDLSNIPEVEYFLYGLNGELIAASRNRSSLFNSYESAVPLTGSNNREVSEYQNTILNEEVVGYYSSVIGTPWTVEAVVPVSTLDQPFSSTSLPIVTLLLIATAALIAGFLFYLYRTIVPSANRLLYQMNTFSLQQPQRLQPSTRQDELGQLQNALNRLMTYIQGAYDTQISRFDKLEKDFHILYELSNVLGVRDNDFVMNETARIIREQYRNVDYVQIFLLDKSRRAAVLRAATGDTGRRLIVQEHQQLLGEGGIIANTVLLGTTSIVNNIDANVEYNLNNVFTDTKSVIVIPIKTHNETIGVLDVHSSSVSAFGQEDVQFFEIIASDLGIVLGREFIQPDTRMLGNMLDVNQPLRTDVATLAAVAGVSTITTDDWSPLQHQAMETRSPAVEESGDETVTFALPVILRDEVLGAVEWTIDQQQYNPELLQTAIDLIDRLAIAIDNARLFEQSQRLVERERQVNEITQKITQQNDIRQILQVAVRELGQALGTPDTVIKLNIDRQSE